MYILQLSDFHLYDKETEEAQKRYTKVIDAVIRTLENKQKSKEKTKLLIAVCGDIVDQKENENRGKVGGYTYAKSILNNLNNRLNDKFDVVFGFVPGNHDNISNSFTNFFAFSDAFNFHWDPTNDDLVCAEIDNTDFIFINSAKEDISRGYISFDTVEDQLKKLDLERKKVLLLHHTVMSMDSEDTSSIVNAARLISLLDKYNVSLVLHGHTHGLAVLSVGSSNSVILGVGALFSRENPDVNSQFNLISLDHGIPEMAVNYTYRNDDPTGAAENPIANELKLPTENIDCTFGGPNISDAYHKLLDAVRINKCLYNISIKGIYDYENFIRDVQEHFGRKKEFGIDCAALAEAFQSRPAPEFICFSHGEHYYNKNTGENGIDYIIKMLRNKKTSSRAVLSTCGMLDIYGAEEDSFLPSLMIIQFSFDLRTPETLKVTMYLRALEVEHFLKINICELAYLTRKIRKAGIRFNRVEITLNAFRAQIQENFCCFIKSELDRLGSMDIQSMVINRDYKKIAMLLEEKKNHVETVIISNGIETLKSAVDWCGKNNKPYPKDIVKALDEVYQRLQAIQIMRKQTSIYSELDKEEEALQKSIEKAAMAFQRSANREGARKKFRLPIGNHRNHLWNKKK